MTGMVRGLFGLALAATALLATVAPGVAQEAPSGTVEMTSISAAAGFGFNLGDGILTLPDGSKHKFSVENPKIAAVGVSTVKATGSVYNLKRVRDLEGVYQVVEAGIAIGAGVSGMVMKNEHGVVIHLHTTQLGINFTFGIGGMSIKMKSHLF